MQALSIFQSMGDVEVQSWIYKWMTFHLGRNKLRHLRTSKAKQSQCRRVKRQNRKAKIPRVTPRRLRGSERKAAGWFGLLRSRSLGCRLPVCFPRDHGCWHCATPCSFDLLQQPAECCSYFHQVLARAHHGDGTHCSVTDGTHLLYKHPFVCREDWYLCPFLP